MPFRVICRRLGADLVYTEFINAEGLTREDPSRGGRASAKMRFLSEERPIAIQLYGARSESMARAAELAADREPDIIDINCGCWVRKVALQGAGAGLLRDLDAMARVVTSVIRATSLPVTVKTRLGWDAATIRVVEVARMLEDIGVQGLTVQCRTRVQGFAGRADHSWIPRVRAAVRMPVVLNGDVMSAEDVATAFDVTHCDGVMIGRGAIRNPWVFQEARHLLRAGRIPAPPTLSKRVDLCLMHLDLAMEFGGERYAITSLRRHYIGYFRGIRGAANLRYELARHTRVDALRDHLRRVRPDA